MRTLRFRLVLLVAWTFLLTAVESVGGLGPLSPVTDKFALAVTLVLIASPKLARLPWPWLAFPAMAGLLLVKMGLGHPIVGGALAGSILGVGAIAATTILAIGVATSLEEFRKAVSRLGLRCLRERPRKFGRVQGHLYREVRRARLSRQPLTLLALSARPRDGEAWADRVMKDAIQDIVSEHVHGRLAEALQAETTNCDLVARLGDHLVAVLPVTTAEEATEIAQRLQKSAQEKMGLEVAVGRASFPDEEVTLVGLLQRAEVEMRKRAAEEAASNGSGQQAKHHASENGKVLVSHAIAANGAHAEGSR